MQCKNAILSRILSQSDYRSRKCKRPPFQFFMTENFPLNNIYFILMFAYVTSKTVSISEQKRKILLAENMSCKWRRRLKEHNHEAVCSPGNMPTDYKSTSLRAHKPFAYDIGGMLQVREGEHAFMEKEQICWYICLIWLYTCRIVQAFPHWDNKLLSF